MKLVVIALLAIVMTGCASPNIPTPLPKIVTSLPHVDACTETQKAIEILNNNDLEGARVHFKKASTFAQKYERDAPDRATAARFVKVLDYFANVPVDGYSPAESSPDELEGNSSFLSRECSK